MPYLLPEEKSVLDRRSNCRNAVEIAVIPRAEVVSSHAALLTSGQRECAVRHCDDMRLLPGRARRTCDAYNNILPTAQITEETHNLEGSTT